MRLSDGWTDRQTDSSLIAILHPHSMQRGKNCEKGECMKENGKKKRGCGQRMSWTKIYERGRKIVEI